MGMAGWGRPGPLAPHARGGGKGLHRAPWPRWPEGPGVQPPAPRARASPAHPHPDLWPPRGLLPAAYPRAVVAHHHLPALAVHRPPGREPPLLPPLLPPHNLQPPPTASAARPFPLPPPPSSQPLLGLCSLPQPEVATRPHPAHGLRDTGG